MMDGGPFGVALQDVDVGLIDRLTDPSLHPGPNPGHRPHQEKTVVGKNEYRQDRSPDVL
jgi:hypothetical protein